MAEIFINQTTCIRCGKCSRICPANIFVQSSAHTPINIVEPENCIICGHCVGVCPTDAVEHANFPSEKIHPFNIKDFPSTEQMMLLCKARRSNRAFSARPIPEEKLQLILEAAHCAPTASNSQQVAFTLVTDPDKLRLVSEFTLQTFNAASKKLTNPILKPLLKLIKPDVYHYLPVFKRLSEQYQAGNDLILRKATAVLFIHTPGNNRFGNTDTNLAYQNGSLMAECAGVNQFYTGFVCSAIQQDGKNTLEKSLGIKGKIGAGMALGMPEFRFSKYIDKKAIEVTRI